MAGAKLIRLTLQEFNVELDEHGYEREVNRRDVFEATMMADAAGCARLYALVKLALGQEDKNG